MQFLQKATKEQLRALDFPLSTKRGCLLSLLASPYTAHSKALRDPVKARVLKKQTAESASSPPLVLWTSLVSLTRRRSTPTLPSSSFLPCSTTLRYCPLQRIKNVRQSNGIGDRIGAILKLQQEQQHLGAPFLQGVRGKRHRLWRCATSDRRGRPPLQQPRSRHHR